MMMRKKDQVPPSRMAALLESCRRDSKQKVLFISHHMGGGCERHMQELAAVVQDRVQVVTVRPSDSKGAVLRLGTDPKAEGLHFNLPQNYKDLLDLCAYLDISRVHFHHVMGIHPVLRNLAQDLKVSCDITLHDFYFINANPTLTDRNGRYCADGLNRDRLCAETHPVPGGVSPRKWREQQKEFLKKAERVLVPSRYAADLYLDYFPDLNPIVAWHPDWEKNAPYPSPRRRAPRGDRPMRVLVLGALNRQKGADLLESCARAAKRHSAPLEFHLIGYATRPLTGAVSVHGPYEDDELGTLISKSDPHLIWFPAQWPETYSYTLSAALESGRPLVVPDIGAFPERVRGRPLTWVEPWDKPADRCLEFFLDLRDRMSAPEEGEASRAWEEQQEQRAEFSYRSDYVIPSAAPGCCDSGLFVLNTAWLSRFICSDRRSLGERILRLLLKGTEVPIMAKLLNLVPYDFRRRVKRIFSRKPIHDVLRKDL